MLESIEKLRESLKDCTSEAGVEPNRFDTYWITAKACDVLIDEVEAEINERYMPLPVDADGVPIRVGDVVEFGENRNQGIVKALNEHMVIATHVDDGCMNYAKYGLLWNADACRHVKPRTVEDMLIEMLETAVGYSDAHTTVAYSAVEKYADELRDMMKEGGDD